MDGLATVVERWDPAVAEDALWVLMVVEEEAAAGQQLAVRNARCLEVEAGFY